MTGACRGGAYTEAVSVAPHPDLGPLLGLVGAWEGDGRGRWADGEAFGYHERLEFSHAGKPQLAYRQVTRSADDDRPLHSESGWWRAVAPDSVELVVAQGIGVVEIGIGSWEDAGRLRLRSQTVATTPTAKTVTAVERDYVLEADILSYELLMSTDGGPVRWHLAAELRRVPS